MSRYRRRPLEVEAVQWVPGSTVEGVRTVAGFEDNAPVRLLEARHGWMPVLADDWIVTDNFGEQTVLSPAEFAVLYEAVQ